MTVSYFFIIVFFLALGQIIELSPGTMDEAYSVTNFLIAFGIISICSRLDDLKRK